MFFRKSVRCLHKLITTFFYILKQIISNLYRLSDRSLSIIMCEFSVNISVCLDV